MAHDSKSFFEGDFETCSWCTTEVLDEYLTEIADGARICPECVRDAQEMTEAKIGGGAR